MLVVSSFNNPRVKQIRALHNRRHRERTGLCFAEGIHVVRQAASAGAEIVTLVAAPEALTSRPALELVDQHRSAGGDVVDVSSSVFQRLSSRDRPAGLAAVIRQRWQHLPACADEGGCWVALAGIQAPGNLGAVLRSCDASGASGVILIGSTADPYDPAAIRAGMGTVFSIPLVRAGVEEFVAWTRRSASLLIGTSGDGGRDYRRLTYRTPIVLLMGAEQHGLPSELLEACDQTAHIPMVGRADSLNLAVAAGLMLYEVFRQRYPPVDAGQR
jgi:TrmH family RNA methyltransferase